MNRRLVEALLSCEGTHRDFDREQLDLVELGAEAVAFCAKTIDLRSQSETVTIDSFEALADEGRSIVVGAAFGPW